MLHVLHMHLEVKMHKYHQAVGLAIIIVQSHCLFYNHLLTEENDDRYCYNLLNS